jgi:hypothetical protein
VSEQTALICDCCERAVMKTRWLPLVSAEKRMLCDDCLYEWYDGGQTDAAKIKAAVLKHHELGGLIGPAAFGTISTPEQPRS